MGGNRNTFCGDGWGWNGSSAGMGEDGSEMGRGRVGTDILSAAMGMGVMCVPAQASDVCICVYNAHMRQSTNEIKE